MCIRILHFDNMLIGVFYVEESLLAIHLVVSIASTPERNNSIGTFCFDKFDRFVIVTNPC